MKLSPVEIEGHNFKVVWRGYDPDEVRAFLSQIAHEVTNTLRVQQKLNEQNEVKSQRLKQVEYYEEKLRDALVTATQMTDSTVENAQREAELIIKEAEVQADQILAAGRSELRRLQEEIHTFRRQRERLSIELRALIESHLRMLDNQVDMAQGREQAWSSDSWDTQSGDHTIQPQDEALESAQALTVSLSSELNLSDPLALDMMNSEPNPAPSLKDPALAISQVKPKTLKPLKSIGRPSGQHAMRSSSTPLTSSVQEPMTSTKISGSTSLSTRDATSTASIMPLQDPLDRQQSDKSGMSDLQQLLSDTPKRVSHLQISTQAPQTFEPPPEH